MAADRSKLLSEDAVPGGCIAQFVEVHEKASDSNVKEDGPGFQAISMVMKWDSKSISEVRNEAGHFEPASMAFKLNAQGDIEIPPGVSLPEWLAVKDLPRKLEPPLVYILNHEIFSGNHEERFGSAIDVENLKRTFGRLKCQVEVVENPTTIDVKETITKLEKTNFDHLSALVVIILSHGGVKELIVACDDKEYHLDKDVLEPLCKIESLRGKPKILIIQACKGGLKADAKPEEYGYYIKCYSTSEGYKAYRYEEDGSIYIQTLCQVMDQDALTKDFSDIIKDVKAKTVDKSTMIRHKQVPDTDGILGSFCFGDYVD